MSHITPPDIYLFKEGTHAALYQKLGCQLSGGGGRQGADFAVWAPNAREVSVIGEWNGWNPGADRMRRRDDQSGIWQAHVPDVAQGHAYKYRVVSGLDGVAVDKADPF